MPRLVAIADTHNHHRDLIVPDGDIFIFAGDMSNFNRSRQHYIDFNNWVGGLPHSYKLICPGNHDERFEQHPEEIPELTTNYTYMNEKEIIINGIKFYGCAYQPEFYGWGFNLPRGPKLAEKWAKVPDDTDVLISHGPPYQILDYAGGINLGCEDLLKRVFEVKPKLHIFGHIHECRGRYVNYGLTTFFNVGMNKNNQAYIIDLLDDGVEIND